MSWFFQDLRFGIRMLIKRPGISLIAVIALALGLGLTTTMFSIIDGILLKGFPFPDAGRLIAISRTDSTQGPNRQNVPIQDYADWRQQQRTFEDIAGYYQGTVNLGGKDGNPERVSGAFITPNLFQVLIEQTAMGRAFRDEENDPGGPPIVILGNGIWRRRYGADPGILGKTIRANSQDMTVVGVMPADFRFPSRQEVWLPLRMDPVQTPRPGGPSLNVVGRLRSGVSRDQAMLEFTGIAGRLAQAYPETNKGIGVRIEPLIDASLNAAVPPLLYRMLVAVFGVLLIACSNVANLILARATVRTREVAIRTALGGGRGRVASQTLIETLVLTVTGGLLGLGLAQAGITLFNRAIALNDPPYWIDIRLNGAVLVFVAVVTVLSAFIAGIVPALQASGTNMNEALKDESRGSSSLKLGRFSKTLVVAEIALSAGLLIAAGLMTRSLITLKTFDYGVATTNVFTARIDLAETSYPDSLKRQRFWSSLLERLGAEPGIRAVTLTTRLPALSMGSGKIAIEGQVYADDRQFPSARDAVASPDYFKAFDLPIVQGRAFRPSDDGSAVPVAIVNQSFARQFAPPDGSILGVRLREGTSRSTAPWRTIVGVVPDVKDMQMAGMDMTRQGYYVPLAQSDQRSLSIAAQAGGDPLALAAVLRRDLSAIDPDQPFFFAGTERQAIDQANWFYVVFGTLFMVFGGVALLLASVGLYGVMAFTVSRRTREVGVRMALGARRREVMGMFLRQGAIQLGIGISIGLVLAFFLAQGLGMLLFNVNSADPVVFVLISAMLLVVGLLACVIPARQATRVDPLTALRYD